MNEWMNKYFPIKPLQGSLLSWSIVELLSEKLGLSLGRCWTKIHNQAKGQENEGFIVICNE